MRSISSSSGKTPEIPLKYEVDWSRTLSHKMLSVICEVDHIRHRKNCDVLAMVEFNDSEYSGIFLVS